VTETFDPLGPKVAGALASGVSGAAIFYVLVLATIGDSHPGLIPYGILAVDVAAVVYAVVRSTRVRLVVGVDTIEVHNVLRSLRLPWDEIVAVEPAKGLVWMLTPRGPGRLGEGFRLALRSGQHPRVAASGFMRQDQARQLVGLIRVQADARGIPIRVGPHNLGW